MQPTHSIRPLCEVLDDIARQYPVSEPLMASARALDPRALKVLGSLVGRSLARLPPLEIHEVTKWGICWGASVYPEIRRIATARERDEARGSLTHLLSLCANGADYA